MRAQVIAGPLRKALADLAAALETGRPFEPRTSARTFMLAFRDYGEFVILRQLLALVAEGAPSASLVVQAPNSGVHAALTVGALDMYVGVPRPTGAGASEGHHA